MHPSDAVQLDFSFPVSSLIFSPLVNIPILRLEIFGMKMMRNFQFNTHRQEEPELPHIYPKLILIGNDDDVKYSCMGKHEGREEKRSRICEKLGKNKNPKNPKSRLDNEINKGLTRIFRVSHRSHHNIFALFIGTQSTYFSLFTRKSINV